jgi:hypothetical protein
MVVPVWTVSPHGILKLMQNHGDPCGITDHVDCWPPWYLAEPSNASGQGTMQLTSTDQQLSSQSEGHSTDVLMHDDNLRNLHHRTRHPILFSNLMRQVLLECKHHCQFYSRRLKASLS